MSTEGEAPRRLRAADVIDQQHEALIAALTGRDSVPWVTVEITDAAKGEVRVETKVSAPLGCDLLTLADHADTVRAIAENEHTANTARKGEAVSV